MWNVRLELTDVFGGDGEIRYEPVEEVKISRVRTKTMVKDSIGLAFKVGTEEEIREKKMEPIATFRLGEDGVAILRLGGAHGKFWGALKQSAKELYQLGDEEFKRSYKSAMEMISVSPTWIPLETDEDFRVEGIPQILKGRAGGMIVQRFDVIPRATAHVLLNFPDLLERKVKRLLEHVQIGSHLNKRRTLINIMGVEPEGQ